MSEIIKIRAEEGEEVELPSTIGENEVITTGDWIYMIDNPEAERATYTRRKKALSSDPSLPSPENMIVIRFTSNYVDYLEA